MAKKNHGPKGARPFPCSMSGAQPITILLEWEVDPGTVTVAFSGKKGKKTVAWSGSPFKVGAVGFSEAGSPANYQVTVNSQPTEASFLQWIGSFFRKHFGSGVISMNGTGDNIVSTVTEGNAPYQSDTNSCDAAYS